MSWLKADQIKEGLEVDHKDQSGKWMEAVVRRTRRIQKGGEHQVRFMYLQWPDENYWTDWVNIQAELKKSHVAARGGFTQRKPGKSNLKVNDFVEAWYVDQGCWADGVITKLLLSGPQYRVEFRSLPKNENGQHPWYWFHDYMCWETDSAHVILKKRVDPIADGIKAEMKKIQGEIDNLLSQKRTGEAYFNRICKKLHDNLRARDTYRTTYAEMRGRLEGLLATLKNQEATGKDINSVWSKIHPNRKMVEFVCDIQDVDDRFQADLRKAPPVPPPHAAQPKSPRPPPKDVRDRIAQARDAECFAQAIPKRTPPPKNDASSPISEDASSTGTGSTGFNIQPASRPAAAGQSLESSPSAPVNHDPASPPLENSGKPDDWL